MKKIIAIKANTYPPRYIERLVRKPNGQYTPVYAENNNNARDFKTMAAAAQAIETFFNPFGRSFTIETITVDRKQMTEEMPEESLQ